MWLNRDIKLINKWDKLEIEKRAETLSNRFVAIWEIPDIQIEINNTNDEVNIFDAEDPTGKKLDYAIFFDKKIEVTDVTKLYIEVFKQLFDLQPETFFTSEIGKKIGLTKNPSEDGLKASAPLNDTYFIDTNFSNVEKFKRLKQALTILGIEDELSVKYAD